MKKEHLYFPSADGLTQIHAIRWSPEGDPRAVVQISHGMQEHIDRYDAFATFLAAQGFCVVGNDHLGHGQSVVSEDKHGYFAKEQGNQCVIADLHALRTQTAALYPSAPYFMLGHSMGSFLLRQYLTLHGAGLAGAIIMGTGWQTALTLKTAKALCRLIALFHGWEYRSPLVDGLACGSFNRRFAPARTGHDWLTKDTAIVDRYEADPWCSFVFTLNAYYNLFTGLEIAETPAQVARIPKQLPLFLVAGADDPVGNFGAGVKRVCAQYKAAGLTQVRMKLYETDRHELLNETDREAVYADLLAWLEEHLPAEPA